MKNAHLSPFWLKCGVMKFAGEKGESQARKCSPSARRASPCATSMPPLRDSAFWTQIFLNWMPGRNCDRCHINRTLTHFEQFLTSCWMLGMLEKCNPHTLLVGASCWIFRNAGKVQHSHTLGKFRHHVGCLECLKNATLHHFHYFWTSCWMLGMWLSPQRKNQTLQ